MIPADFAEALTGLLHMACGSLITWLVSKVMKKKPA